MYYTFESDNCLVSVNRHLLDVIGLDFVGRIARVRRLKPLGSI